MVHVFLTRKLAAFGKLQMLTFSRAFVYITKIALCCLQKLIIITQS